MSVIDLGCGTGGLTAMLAKELPDATILGVDSSPEMMKETVLFQSARVRFELRTINEQLDDSSCWDLIFSNAALQWVGDHRALIPRLISKLNKNGQLAVQVPSNHLHCTHLTLQEIASQEPFRSVLKGWVRAATVLGIEAYSELLYASGAKDITVFEKVYPHILADADAVFDWVSGTALVPYLDNLPSSMHIFFQDVYREKLHEKFTTAPAFYPFKRTIFYATFP